MNARKKGNDLELIVPTQWNQLTVEALLKTEWQLPKKVVHELRMNKAVIRNGECIPFFEKISQGDQLIITNVLINEPSTTPPSMEKIQIVYEDDFILIANKPAGIATHPNSPADQDTLTNRITGYLLNKGEQCNIKHIHRLDKDTTGAVLFAKSSFLGAILDKQLTERKIKRIYTAIVHGKLNKSKGTIEAKIGRDRHHATRRRVSPTGQEAITHYEVITYDSQKNISQIQCQLDTGRTHQIRVHLAQIGHPLIGDTLYGGKPIFYRQALHAKTISLTHPFTLERITVQVPFLDDFPRLL